MSDFTGRRIIARLLPPKEHSRSGTETPRLLDPLLFVDSTKERCDPEEFHNCEQVAWWPQSAEGLRADEGSLWVVELQQCPTYREESWNSCLYVGKSERKITEEVLEEPSWTEEELLDRDLLREYRPCSQVYVQTREAIFGPFPWELRWTDGSVNYLKLQAPTGRQYRTYPTGSFDPLCAHITIDGHPRLLILQRTQLQSISGRSRDAHPKDELVKTLLDRARSYVHRTDPELAQLLTKDRIRQIKEILASAVGTAQGDTDLLQHQFERGRPRLEDLSKRLVAEEEFMRDLMETPPLRTRIERACAAAQEQRRGELAKSLEEESRQRRAEAEQQIAEHLKERRQEVSRLQLRVEKLHPEVESLERRQREAEAAMLALRHHLEGERERLVHDFFAMRDLLRADLGVLPPAHPCSGAYPQPSAAPDPAVTEAAFLEALSTSLRGMGSVSEDRARWFHAGFLADPVVFVEGYGGPTLVEAYLETLGSATRTLWLTASAEWLAPQDWLGRPIRDGRFLPAVGGTIDFWREALADPARLFVLVLQDANRAPVECYLGPLLNRLSNTRGGPFALFHPAAVDPTDGYADVAYLAWPANLRLIAMLSEGSSTFPLPPPLRSEWGPIVVPVDSPTETALRSAEATDLCVGFQALSTWSQDATDLGADLALGRYGTASVRARQALALRLRIAKRLRVLEAIRRWETETRVSTTSVACIGGGTAYAAP